jgi:hypothetical protein
MAAAEAPSPARPKAWYNDAGHTSTDFGGVPVSLMFHYKSIMAKSLAGSLTFSLSFWERAEVKVL